MRVPIGENLRPLLALYAAPHLVGMVGPGNQHRNAALGFSSGIIQEAGSGMHARGLKCKMADRVHSSKRVSQKPPVSSNKLLIRRRNLIVGARPPLGTTLPNGHCF
jgi:hypothetical protein